MKKISLLLILILMLSCVAVGCGTEDISESSSAPDSVYFVRDGASDYKIVIPENAGNLIGVASEEFYDFFLESTSVKLSTVTDSQVDYGGKYFSIGETTQLKASGVTYSREELGGDGFKIKTVGNTVYLIGATDYGSLYAVYELLSELVGYDFIYEDCYTIDTGVTELPFRSFDIKEVPDIESRTASDGVVSGDNYSLYRMRVRPYLENFITINGYWCHNSFQYVNNDDRCNYDWYSEDRTQLCYTAHGDESEYADMIDASFLTLKDELIAQPDKNMVTFTMQDNFDVCHCSACQKAVEQYGAISATIMLFLNDLDDKVNEWFDSEDGKAYSRDLKILFFAYLGYEDAPATYNSKTQKYEAKGGITLNDNVYCYLCPINMDYYRSINDAANEQYYSTVKAWGDITDSLYLWYYSTNFYYYLAPYDNFDSMRENYRFAVLSGAIYLFDLRQHDESGFVTGWSNLKSYLNSKLAWDCNADVTALTDKFFNAYFGAGAADMRNYYNSMRTLTNYNKQNNGLGGTRSLYAVLPIEKYWPKNVLEQWLRYCDAAESKISGLKESDNALWNSYKQHIDGERAAVLYLFVECYSYNTSGEVIGAYKADFKQIAVELGISKLSEGVNISTLYEKWGIA